MAHALSYLFTRLFDGLLAPFDGAADAALAAVSVLCGVASILIFRAISDQPGIRRTRDRLVGHILEMRVYQDDLRLILRALGAALATNLRYLRLALAPLLVIAALLAIVFVQLDARFARSALHTNDRAQVSVICRPGVDVMSVAIETGYGVAVEAPRVRVPDQREVHWRVRTYLPDASHVLIRIAGATYRFPLAARSGTGVKGDERSRAPLDALLHPGLPSLPRDLPIEKVTVRYPPARHWLFGLRTHWLWAFVAWSFLGALVPKLLFRIEV